MKPPPKAPSRTRRFHTTSALISGTTASTPRHVSSERILGPPEKGPVLHFVHPDVKAVRPPSVRGKSEGAPVDGGCARTRPGPARTVARRAVAIRDARGAARLAPPLPAEVFVAASLVLSSSLARGLPTLRAARSPLAFISTLGAATATPGVAPAGGLTEAGRATTEATATTTTRPTTAAEATSRRPRAPRPWPSRTWRPTGRPATHGAWPSRRRRGAPRRRLVDADHAAVEAGPVHSGDRPVSLVLGAHLDEAEAARTLGLTVGHHHRRLHRAVPRERVPQAVVGSREGKSAHEELHAHAGVLFTPSALAASSPRARRGGGRSGPATGRSRPAGRRPPPARGCRSCSGSGCPC